MSQTWVICPSPDSLLWRENVLLVFFLFWSFFNFFNAYGCFICTYVCAPRECPRRPKDGIRSSGTELKTAMSLAPKMPCFILFLSLKQQSTLYQVLKSRDCGEGEDLCQPHSCFLPTFSILLTSTQHHYYHPPKKGHHCRCLQMPCFPWILYHCI